jgi:hypothetical protein
VMRFCLPCITVVNRLDAAVVAQDEAPGGASFEKLRGYSAGMSVYSRGHTPSHSFVSSESSQLSSSSHHGHSAWSSSSTRTKPSRLSASHSTHEGFIVY